MPLCNHGTWSNDCLERQHLNKASFQFLFEMYFRVTKLIFYFKVFLFEQNRKLALRIFLFYMIFLHAWVLSFNVLKLLFFQSSRSFDIMTSKRDLQSYFAKSDNAKVKSRSQKDKPKASCLIQSALNVSGKTEI